MLEARDADTIFINGDIHSFNENYAVYQAIAIKDGFILEAGLTEYICSFAKSKTKIVDLQGKTVIPGLIDSHMHPLWGAKMLTNYSLDYEPFTCKEIIERLTQYIKNDDEKEKDAWLRVAAWLRIGGSEITRHELDTLPTDRPIILFSNDCHFVALNSRGLKLMGITKDTPEPSDGKIIRDKNNEPVGIIEDAPAMRIFDAVTQGKNASELITLVQTILNSQGVTTVMDARADYGCFDAVKELQKNNTLSLRVMGAREITPDSCPTANDAERSVEEIILFANKYKDAEWTPSPGVDITHIKLFIDGILQTKTAFMLEPYLENFGTDEEPDFKPGTNVHFPYFTQEVVNAILLAAANHNLHPHTHTIASGAIELVLHAVENMRQAFPHKDIRVSLAHQEQVNVHQYKKISSLNVYPVLSFQWAGMPDDLFFATKDILGHERFNNGAEPHGRFIDAGAKIAFGSDWPIDPFDEWYDFQVACTRQIPGGLRLDSDRNLTMKEVITAATRHAAEALGKEKFIGTVEKGKFADFVVLDRNIFIQDPATIHKTKVLQTVVGGNTVYHAEELTSPCFAL